MDPLDQITEREQAWETFRATYAAALFLVWLHKEIQLIRPDYLEDLRIRVVEGILNGAQLAADDPTYDGAAPISDPEPSRGVTFWDAESAQLLEEQLFPHQGSDRGYWDYAAGAATAALHAALESYATATGISMRRIPLPLAIERHLAAKPGASQLDPKTSRDLIECDATRHLYAHNVGVVNQEYVNRVPFNQQVLGERRIVDHATLQRYADAIWHTGVAIRDAGS